MEEFVISIMSIASSGLAGSAMDIFQLPHSRFVPDA
jgi:hypothetical protein